MLGGGNNQEHLLVEEDDPMPDYPYYYAINAEDPTIPIPDYVDYPEEIKEEDDQLGESPLPRQPPSHNVVTASGSNQNADQSAGNEANPGNNNEQ